MGDQRILNNISKYNLAAKKILENRRKIGIDIANLI